MTVADVVEAIIMPCVFSIVRVSSRAWGQILFAKFPIPIKVILTLVQNP